MDPVRVLFATFPQSGHVNPGLPVAEELVSRGHQVCWYTSPRFRDRIEATGARFVPYQDVDDVDIEDMAEWLERFPETAKPKGALAEAKFGIKHVIVGTVLQKCREIDRLLDDFPADVVVGDTGALAPAFITERRGLPYVLLNITVPMFRSTEVAPFGLGIAPSATALGKLRNRLLNWIVFDFIFRDVNVELQKVRAQYGLPPDDLGFFDLTAARCDLYLEPTVEAFEFPRSDLPDKVHFIGALLPRAGADFTPPGWWDDLNTDRPVVLVTQGTLAKEPDDLMNPTIRALADEDVLLVVAAGDQAAQEGLVRPLPDNVRVEPFIPFAHLMPHVDVMVTNAGFGGTHFALSHGVPLVAAGRSEDKIDVCMRIAAAGVGVDLKAKSPEPARVKAAVKSVLADSRFAERARRLQAELAKHDGPVEAADLIERLLRSRSATAEPPRA